MFAGGDDTCEYRLDYIVIALDGSVTIAAVYPGTLS
jgi:hypothetical protein